MTELRLFCFPHAGGGASAYTGWDRAMPPGITVRPVQLPGRENRVREPRVRDMAALLRLLDDELVAELRPPFAFYGHSMGALVAYAFAREHRPTTLFVGGYPAPHHPPPLTDALAAPDRALFDLLVGLGGLSAELIAYPSWQRAALDLVRDDLAVCDSFRATGAEPLTCPIHVFAGWTDPIVPLVRALAWDRHTTAGSRLHLMPGGHFFARDAADDLLAALVGLLQP